MDGQQFDQMTCEISAGAPSRRGLLRALAGGALAGTLGLFGAGDALAGGNMAQGKKCKKSKKCGKGMRCER